MAVALNDAGKQRSSFSSAMKAALVFSLTVGLVVSLGIFVFRPLFIGNAFATEGERYWRVTVDSGRADSIERAKYWGDGPVIGPAFTPRDKTFPVNITRESTRPDGEKFTPAITDPEFAFRVPPEWTCGALHQADPPHVGWFCADAGTIGSAAHLSSRPLVGPGPVRGYVFLSPCKDGPCDPEAKKLDPRHTITTSGENRRMQDAVTKREYTGRVRWSDPTTAYVEQTVRRDGEARYLLSMDHFWSREGERPDVRVAVTLSGPPEAKVEIQKMVNDLREATP